MDFIEKCKQKHGDKYLYTKTIYLNSKTKVEIICPNHGSFFQKPHSHLNGNGCRKCYNVKQSEKTKSPDVFIEECVKIHGNKYNYSKTYYKDVFSKVIIICSTHGEFLQNPSKHLSGNGCPKCSGRKRTNEEFIDICSQKHENKYDYSLVRFVNNKTNIDIICKKHGVFQQKAGKHIQGSGCQLCSNGVLSTKNEFILKAKKVHGDFYDYSKTNYFGARSKLKIICKNHGEFYQTATHHLSGQGCRRCKCSRGENIVRSYLENNNILFEDQYSFNDLKKYRFDFYLTDYKICIEFDGIQHFEPIVYFGGIKRFEKQKQIDCEKDIYCKNNNINLIRIPYFEKNVFELLDNQIRRRRNQD